MRIQEHPILEMKPTEIISFYFNGVSIEGRVGDTIASALHAAGVKVLSKSIHHHRPRGFYCAIGNCSSCHMTVNGVANVKTCITPLAANMHVEYQDGKGVIR